MKPKDYAVNILTAKQKIGLIVFVVLAICITITSYQLNKKHDVTLEAICTFEGDATFEEVIWDYRGLNAQPLHKAKVNGASCRVTAVIPTTSDYLKEIEDVIANPQLKYGLIKAINEDAL